MCGICPLEDKTFNDKNKVNKISLRKNDIFLKTYRHIVTLYLPYVDGEDDDVRRFIIN